MWIWISVIPPIIQGNDQLEYKQVVQLWLYCRQSVGDGWGVCWENCAIWFLWFGQLAQISCEIWKREREACDTPHSTLMRSREPKELGNKIRCNSIQLLLSRHGWRFKTHPVKIQFIEEEEDCSSHSTAVCHAATASHSQKSSDL